ncbi:MAG TPA: hypothetical protein VNC11_02185 [Gemmatimonadaceae bacterium]|nr:hypothetical protein [Gemmatimonadaceae bacterium]
MPALTRRNFLRVSSASLVGAISCNPFDIIGADDDSARLTARPRAPKQTLAPGTYKLEFGDTRDGYLLVPQSSTPSKPAPLLLALHGAGIGATGPINFLGPYAEEFGFVLLAPDSRGVTWDAIHDGFGPDVRFINRALLHAFDSCAIDPNRIYIEGFSDGASYALGLGPANPELFKRVIAFSAGLIPLLGHPVNGMPEIFVSHGVDDPVLPYSNAIYNIVPTLQNAGFPVTFVPFEGGHTVPSFVARPAIQWMLNP